MKFLNPEIGLSIEIGDQLVNEIHEAAMLHYPKEFGGILIGQYADDRLMVSITETILPSNFKSSRISFDRGTDGLKERLSALFAGQPSKIYVGEWHSHPDAAPVPSVTDIRALQQIVADEGVNIDSPVMLIIGLTKASMELGFYVYLNKKIYRYEMV